MRVLDGAAVSVGQFDLPGAIACMPIWADGTTPRSCGGRAPYLTGEQTETFWFMLTGPAFRKPRGSRQRLAAATYPFPICRRQSGKRRLHDHRGICRPRLPLRRARLFLRRIAPLSDRVTRVSADADHRGSTYFTMDDHLPALPANGGFDVYLGAPLNLELGRDKFTAIFSRLPGRYSPFRFGAF